MKYQTTRRPAAVHEKQMVPTRFRTPSPCDFVPHHPGGVDCHILAIAALEGRKIPNKLPKVRIIDYLFLLGFAILNVNRQLVFSFSTGNPG